MLVPSPMEHLKSHAIAFVAGALTLVAVNLYSRHLARQHSENVRGACDEQSNGREL
jgi:hypothetical protein